MRKLRRLPWRIPKPHHAQPAATHETCTRADQDRELERELEREAQRDAMNAQPVAFAAGRYVYGEKPSRARPARTPEIRRKSRHHPIIPFPVVS